LEDKELKVGPALSANDIAAFETTHNITLPLEYREFLISVGNGGSGPPAYGMLALGEIPPNCVPDWFSTGYGDYLSKPFPLNETWIWEDESAAPGFDDQLLLLRNGNICLGTDGCGMYWLLIVTGPERGKIWQLTDVGVTPLVPPRDFTSWYEYWLQGGDDWFQQTATVA
jgi:hypothetical protein